MIYVLNNGHGQLSEDYKLISYKGSLCSECMKRVDAKIVESAGRIFILKII
jgi:uncharacterized radical SAM superfamily Fe-S cluster-containing enzyme